MLLQGTLSLQLPNASTLNYKLIGNAKPPHAVDKIEREIHCKTYYTESLPVQNWLNSNQEFCVTTERIDTKNKMLYKLSGNTIIDVPANAIKEYKWTIYVLKEGVLPLRVIFHNVKTKEYLFYEISLHVNECESLKTIRLSTCARKPISYALELENPIRTQVMYEIATDCNALSFPEKVKIPPLTEVEINV